GHETRDNRSLEHALTQRGIRVTTVARSAGDRVPAPAGFAAVILNDVPSDDLPAGYAAELRAAVGSGMGLAMVGGPRSFGLVGHRNYHDLALALAEQGVTISTIALGRDADTDFLERLASYGRGAFHATADAASLPEIVLGEFESHGREKTLVERTFHPEPSRE